MLLLILAIIGASASVASFVTMLFFILPCLESLDPRKVPKSKVD